MNLKIVCAVVVVLIVGLFLWLWMGERNRAASLASELNQARDESGRVAGELTDAQRVLERRQRENETLTGENQALKDRLAGMERDLASARREGNALESQLVEAQAGRDQTRANLDLLRKTAEEAQAARAQAEARVSGLETETAAAVAEAAALKSQLAALKAGRAAVPDTAAPAPENQAGPPDQAETARLQAALAEAQAEAEKAGQARAAAEEQVKRLTETAAGSGGDQNGLTALRREADQARTDYDRLARDLKSQIDSQEVIISGLRDELSLSFLDRVFFLTGRAGLTPEGAKVLDAVAAALQEPAGSGKLIMVVGHTDDLPMARKFTTHFPTNWELSSARAVAVTRYLTEKGGLPPESLAAVGRSLYQPVAPNDSDENRQKNRRVEIIISNRNQLGPVTGIQ